MPASASTSLLAFILWRVLPVIIVVQLAIGWFALVIMGDLVSTELQSRLNREAKQYARVLAVKVEALVQTATLIAENELIINGIVDAQERDHYIPTFFESMQVPGPAGAEVTLTDYKGRRLASNRVDVDYRNASFSDQVLSGVPWRELSEEGFTAAVPVMIAGVAEGMIVIRYDAADLDRLLRLPADTAAIAVVAKSGHVLHSSNTLFIDDQQKNTAAPSAGWEVASAAIPWFSNLELLTGQKRSSAFALVDRLNYFLWATMLTGIGAVILAIVATAFMSTKPIVRFIDGIERITRTSDLDRKIEPDGTREFHRLASAFNRMLGALKTTTASRDDLKQVNSDLERANRALDQANADLEESDTRYQLAVRGSSVGIWDWDARTNSLFWSDRLKQIVGVDDQTFMPELLSFEQRLHPDDVDRVMAMRRQHLEEGCDYDIECRLRREDGGYIWIHNRGQAIWDEAGNPIRMAGSADDISDRKAAEIKLADYAGELERSNRELDDFAYIASHDLKEPLRALYNHASFLLEDYQDKLDEEGEKRLNRLIKLSRRMEKLIADLLYYSRLGRGKQTSEKLDPKTIIANVEVSLADTLRSRNVRLSVVDSLPAISGNRAHLTTLFQNLIVNGTKYNDAEEKLIEIGFAPSVEHDGDTYDRVFYVRDNGIGIDEMFTDEVFRIFKRLNSEKAYGEGTGAGLTFVKKIVENNGGRIWLQSKPGEGSTFFFTFQEAA